MDKYPMNEACEVERPQLAYEGQIYEIMNQIDRLEGKVKHISLFNEAKEAGMPRENKPALNTALDDVIERLSRVVNRIQN